MHPGHGTEARKQDKNTAAHIKAFIFTGKKSFTGITKFIHVGWLHIRVKAAHPSTKNLRTSVQNIDALSIAFTELY